MSSLPQHPKDHPIIAALQQLDSNIREGLIARDQSMEKLNELCSDNDEDVRYYAAWYAIHHFKNTELYDKASLLLLEPLVKILNETEPSSGSRNTNRDDLIRFFKRHEIVREMERISSLLAIPYLMELFSDTEEYDAWGTDVGVSIAEFAQSAIDKIRLVNKAPQANL